MRRTTMCLFALCAVALAASPAAAQKKPARAAKPAPCVCPEEAEPAAAPIREGGLSECTDGVDNDGDGHIDCTDQDCEIYAVCVTQPLVVQEPPPPPAMTKTYTNMRELKHDLHAGAITGPVFFRWQMTIRAWRDAEVDLAKADYRAGRITKHEYRARVEAIRLKYEG